MGSNVVKCSTCGKVLKNTVSQKAVMGSLCAKHKASGLTGKKLTANRVKLTVKIIPSGFTKLAVVGVKYRACGIPINRLVNAIGRDRANSATLHPNIKVLYNTSGHRFVSNWLLTSAGKKFVLTCK